ncbi:RIPP1 protein, partial [Penelope pileata]|nr:RIPP1 protein [Penelope pileata]
RAIPLWRPWLPREEDVMEQQREQTDTALGTAGDGGPDKALLLFRHPVRLLWPRSQSFDYLYSVGEKLLENFPVQATLCLYDDSDSEEEEEEEEEEEDEEDEEEGSEAGGAVGAASPRPA